MAKGSNQKLKLYYLAKIFIEKTDEDHMINTATILEYLRSYGVDCNRKTVYNDITDLRKLGFGVKGQRVKLDYLYYMDKKYFEFAEMKLLVDAIQSSKFITERKSKELITKLISLGSEYEQSQLNRHVIVKGRIKSMNESIYLIVDDIHNAISNNMKIRFEYLKWDLDKTLKPRKDTPYEASPWALTWDHENYYMIAYDSAEDMIKHFRVDKMRDIELLDQKREGKELFRSFNIAAYSNRSFGMFGGEEVKVRLRFKNELVGVIIDRFGRDIIISPSNEEGSSEVTVEVALSDQFLGWVFALGTGVKILGPDNVVDRYRKELHELIESYCKEQ